MWWWLPATLQIWLGFLGILTSVVVVVYFIATRPKAALLDQPSPVEAAAAAAAAAGTAKAAEANHT